jgi:hypothetical protein
MRENRRIKDSFEDFKQKFCFEPNSDFSILLIVITSLQKFLNYDIEELKPIPKYKYLCINQMKR